MKSKMLITDKFVEALLAAENGEIDVRRSQRAQTVAKWILGHACEVVQDNDPDWITVDCVSERTFRDRRTEYPSEKLVADLCLAIYAGGGFSPAAFDIRDLDDLTLREVLIGHVNSAAHVSRYRPGNLPLGPVRP